MSIENKVEKVLFTREDINSKNCELGKQITKDYEGGKLLVVPLLKGSFIFAADLVREIEMPTRIEFMTTSSYGDSHESSGQVCITQDLNFDLEEYDILVVDDICDSGHTMKSVVEHLRNKGAKTVKSCVLLDKPSRRAVEYDADYVGYTVPDLFIVGYGLNYGDYYRNIPYIFAFVDKEEV